LASFVKYQLNSDCHEAARSIIGIRRKKSLTIFLSAPFSFVALASASASSNEDILAGSTPPVRPLFLNPDRDMILQHRFQPFVAGPKS
jgi:hypothetical protein